MVKAKTLTQNTAYYTLALIIQKVLAFVYFAFLARGLGVEDQGKYTFAFSFTTIFSVFVDVGLASVLTREIAKDREQTKKILANVLGVKLILSVFAYLLIVTVINLMNYPPLTKQLVYLTGFIMLLDNFSTTFWGVLRGNQNLKYESIGGIIFQFLVVGLGLTLLALKVGVTLQVLAVMAGSAFLYFFLCRNASAIAFSATSGTKLALDKKVDYYRYSLCFNRNFGAFEYASGHNLSF